jgi:hypothetical protein
LFKFIQRILPLLLLCVFSATAGAQQTNRPPGMGLGDAIVTGFSGTAASPSQPRPANKSAVDLTFINPDGPSARIIGVGRPGYVWDGRLFQAPKPFDVFAKDTGQVFGVALDDAPAPNIYLAATSAFGLNLVGRGADGRPERRKVGGPGAGWMKGQFGLDLQGDPGSIYKVDGATGVVTLFAKVMLDGVPNPGPALGNLAYDAAHKQLFASDLYTGMIHRFAVADGNEAGTPYDHGVTGRGAANLPPMPFNPANRPNIANNKFNAENPDTWGYAPPERRVWGLAVQAGRLFYSARNGSATEGPQIWSVGIAQDGGLSADARLEVEIAAQPAPYAVSDIAFSQRGAMILAQRAPVAASYDYSAFTKPGEPRVLRYWLKDASDPPSPGFWKPMPEEYAVGFAGTYRNTDGGVALGYGYGPDGMLSGTACEAALWTTGQNLRNNPALRAQLDPGGPLVVNGLQGSPADMVRGANEPPATSYFIDYDDKFDDPTASGHMGSVRINRVACGGPVVVSGEPAAPSAGPGGGGSPGGGGAQGPACFAPSPLTLPPCTQPGQSVSLDVSTPTNWTVAPGGPPTSIVFGPWTALPGHWIEPNQANTAAQYIYTRTFNLPCSPDSYKKGSLQLSGHVAADNSVTSVVLNTSGSLASCPGLTCFTNPAAGTPFTDANPADFKQGLNTLTVTVGNVQGSPTGMSLTGTLTATCGPDCVCGCPPGKVLRGKECVAQTCPPPQVMNADGVCVCPATMVTGAAPGTCVCPRGTVLQGGACVSPCPSPQIQNADGICMCPPPMQPGPIPGACVCPRGTVLQGGACVSPCPSPQIQNADGICMCPPPMVPGPVAGQCICPIGTVLEGKECVKQTTCQPPMVPGPVPGQCICRPGTVPKGKECVPQIECRSPLVPNTTGTDCVCRPGLVQKGRTCVEPEIKQKREKQKREKRKQDQDESQPRQREIEPGMEIPGLGGGFGGGGLGGGGRGSPGGGGGPTGGGGRR